MQHATKFLAIVNDAKTRIQEIDIMQLKAMQQAQEDFYLIDVREESEFQAGHIPGAIHLSKGLIECYIEKTIPDQNATLVLYCGGGYRSALAADNLQKMGYKHVISMDGGYHAWSLAQ